MNSPRLLTLLLTLLLPSWAAAEWRDQLPPAREMELRESVRRVEQETGGRVLRVEPVRRGNQDFYRMKVLTPEGRVRVMQDNYRRDPRRASRNEQPAPAPRDDRSGGLREGMQDE
jgi:hypothetical protein